MPAALRFNERLGISEPCDATDTCTQECKPCAPTRALGKEHGAELISIMRHVAVLLPSLLICSPVLGANERAELLNGGGVKWESFEQEPGDIRPRRVSIAEPAGMLNVTECFGERRDELCGGGPAGVSAVGSQHHISADQSRDNSGDGGYVWLHWLWALAGLVPTLMYLADAALTRRNSDA